MSDKTALLIIDIQKAATGKEVKNPFGYDRCGDYITNINRLISFGQKVGWNICYIAEVVEWHDILVAAITRFAFMKGSGGIQFDKRLNVINSHIFEKRLLSALSNRKLTDFLKEKGIEHLVLCGISADSCVSGTAISAVQEGYNVTVVSDCTIALTDEIASRAFEKLSKHGVRIEKMSDMISSLPT